MKRFFVAVLTLLGFGAMGSGCDVIGRAEYGTPHSDWQVKGVVQNEQGNPIEGIRVVITLGNEYVSGEEPVMTEDICYTDALGNYATGIHTAEAGRGRGEVIYFDDKDGEANGGDFESVESPIDWTQVAYIGKQGWYRGKQTKTLNVTMVLKQQPE